jgi:DNA repair photolyase
MSDLLRETPRSPRGRGTASNPPNRFEPLEVEREEPGPDRVPTQLLHDTSRSIIARNDSPDVGFETSVNPYRGCEHGCVYCLDGATPILMADGSTRPLRAVRRGDEIYGTRKQGHYRHYVRTRVLDHWETRKPAYRVALADGTELIASGDHRFLTERGWKFVTPGAAREQRPHLTTNNELLGIGRLAAGPDFEDGEYRRGYLCGMVRGDGTLKSDGYQREGRSHGDQHHFRLALADREPLDRTREYLAGFGVIVHEQLFREAVGDFRRMDAIRTHARTDVDTIRQLVAWPEAPDLSWRRGFLAGIYDAEGSWSGGCLRISNTDPQIVEAIAAGLGALELGFVIESVAPAGRKPVQVLRLLGGLPAAARFWHSIGNAMSRQRDIEGLALKSSADLRVVAIEPVGDRELFDITTGTGDFIADGVVSHNCYARPFHEYLGFSAGLDFETKILVKPDAPELLRKELMARSWEPQLVVMSGVTDCYQPAERRLEVTRRCLAVLAEFRNPTAIITKNHLVTRDIDLLAELAAHQAAAVTLSITTLDPEVARRMEPRASHPRDRLAAVEALAKAGIPVGVNVAPVIPAITDHELPAILTAAKDAGAHWAKYLLVRLPFAVKELFQDWLTEHFPDRKEKVLSRLRDLRGGKLNDPRFGVRHRGEGPFADQLRMLYETTCRRIDLPTEGPDLSTAAFRRPGKQLGLF